MTRTVAFVILLGYSIHLLPVISRAGAADYEPGTPSTCLFDTGTSSAEPLLAAQLAAKSGWTLLPEDELKHKFRGDMVLLNDRLVVVLRSKSGGAELYDQTAAGPKRRVMLVPGAGKASDAPAVSAKQGAGVEQSQGLLASVQIVENNPGAVMLAARYTRGDGSTAAIQYRLTAGQMIVEVRPAEGTERLLLQGTAQYVVVPDFFADDMVFQAGTVPRQRVRLPAENFFLNLMDDGNAQVMCVWQSSKQGAVAIRSGSGPESPITGCEIEAAKDKSIWIACLEGAGLWHQQAITAEKARAKTTLDWKPPFPAKWRGDLLGGNGMARSWFFCGGAADESDAALPQADKGRQPCCFDGDRAVVRLERDDAAADWPYPAAMLVYAIDRSRATPLTTFCAMDVLRNTLGVGPCQYILQTEGFASETNPTPDSAMAFVEKQFSRKKEQKSAEEIRAILKQTVAHIQQAQVRIGRYAHFAGKVRDLCQIAKASRASSEELGRIAAQFVQAASVTAGEQPTSNSPLPLGEGQGVRAWDEQAQRLADEVVGLIGKDNALADCQRLGAELRAIGAVQDRTLSRCRMIVRWLRQSAAMTVEDDPQHAALAKEIQAQTEQFLQRQWAP